METEFKLKFDSVEELFSIVEEDWFLNICLDTSEQEPELLKNVYYDTIDRKLASKMVSVRIRTFSSIEDDEERYQHTVKLGGKVVDGLHQRFEWNFNTDSKTFDKEEFINGVRGEDDPNELLVEAFKDIDDDELEMLCKTTFERTTYTFGYGDSICEACFDVGKLSAGGKSEPICELELELISGDVEDLNDLANYIMEKTNASKFDLSKFRRCLMLLDNE